MIGFEIFGWLHSGEFSCPSLQNRQHVLVRAFLAWNLTLLCSQHTQAFPVLCLELDIFRPDLLALMYVGVESNVVVMELSLRMQTMVLRSGLINSNCALQSENS